MTKRKYTKKSEYWKDVGYSEYIKEYNRLNRIVDKKSVGFKFTEKKYKRGFGYKTGIEEISISGKVFNRRNFIRMKTKYPERTAAEIAARQFNLISEELATKIQRELAAAGIYKDPENKTPYTLDEIRARQLPQEVWDQMKTLADSKGTTVSHYFFGS